MNLILFYYIFNRELYEIWCRVATVHPSGGKKSTVVSETQRLQSLFHEAGVYPSQSQVLEMIHCARERETPSGTDAAVATNDDKQQRNFLTFGEFCLFANELRQCYERE